MPLAIDRLARDVGDKTLGLVFIDYKSLEVRHLGSIYEGLLEFKLKIAEEDLAVRRERNAEVYVPLAQAAKGRGKKSAASAVHKGEVYLSNDRAERKATGSYYTPDPIVEYIVEHTVGSILDEKLAALEPEFRQAGKTYHRLMENAVRHPLKSDTDFTPTALAQTYAEHKDFVDRTFDIKVLDPAMGSGHFLVEAVDFIADRLLDFLNRFPHNPVEFLLDQMRRNILDSLGEQGVAVDPDKLTNVNLLKRHARKRCIYGVDLNPMAVELAKVSLWLDALTLGAPLNFLDHHLRCGNSLIGEVRFTDSISPGTEREASLCRTVRNMIQISHSADASLRDVTASKSLFDEVEKLARPFKNRLHIETAKHFLDLEPVARGQMVKYPFDEHFDPHTPPPGRERSHGGYLEVLKLAAQPSMRFFHWEIEFPEVFFGFADSQKRHIEHKDKLKAGSAGFDAIVGNPPYVRQEMLKELKMYFRAAFVDTYDGSCDLYVYFIAREIGLLHCRGQMGMIVANKWMKSGYGANLRKFLVEACRPVQLIDFGHAPIFPDADTFPCILIAAKQSNRDILTACTYPRSQWSAGQSLKQYIGTHSVSLPYDCLNTAGWSLDPPSVHMLMGRLREAYPSLQAFAGTKQYFGIKSGCNEAFYISEEARCRIMAEDPSSGQLIKPLVRGRDIDRWVVHENPQYLLFVRRGTDIERYPTIKRRLEQYKKELEPCPEDWPVGSGKWAGRKPGTYRWYELRDAVDYFDIFTGPKLVFQRIGFHSRIAYDDTGRFPNDSITCLPTGDLYVCAILNHHRLKAVGFIATESREEAAEAAVTPPQS